MKLQKLFQNFKILQMRLLLYKQQQKWAIFYNCEIISIIFYFKYYILQCIHRFSTQALHMEDFSAGLLHAENIKQLFCTVVVSLIMD